ncbi:MAG: ShlB/FhaC/HecB family hemolysin secretion/activation protein [Hydrococcus sp. CSU_1_8]|nr:ShlB/FhaC/HecB family hemolysin secretion/activation protein [Hydrococcus sp. CSU_1_8]
MANVFSIHFVTILTFILSLAIPTPRQALAQLGTDEPVRFPQARQVNEREQLVIKQVKVLGSTAFSQKELEAVTDRFIGKEINLDNAYAIRSAITQLYVDNGYTTSAAFLSNEQDVSDGVIEIQVIEGRLEELHIQRTFTPERKLCALTPRNRNAN